MVEGLLIKDYPTLRKVAGFVLQQAAPTPDQPRMAQVPQMTEPPSVQSAEPVVRQSAASGIVRRVPTLRPQPMQEQANPAPRGPVLVLGDVDDSWIEAVRSAGVEPSPDPPPPPRPRPRPRARGRRLDGGPALGRLRPLRRRRQPRRPRRARAAAG